MITTDFFGKVILACSGVVLWLALASPSPGQNARPAITIITLGDSITKGVRAGVKPEETFSALVEAALRKQGHDLRVINVGIGGERTDGALARLEKDVLTPRPRLVTVMYGTNDSYVDRGKTDVRLTLEQYRTNLTGIITRLRTAGIEPVLMTEPRWGPQAKNGLDENPNGRLAKYMEVCRAVAREKKVALVDHFAHWTKQEAEGADIGGWTTDQCHPNPKGHAVMAELMLPVLNEALKPPDPLSDAGRAALHKQLDDSIARIGSQIEKNANDVDLYSRRGDLRFHRGDFAAAVSDYEKMVELKPEIENSHWRRGIAYFYAARYKDAAHQFEIYHSFDDVDRENGIWRFLSQAKAQGIPKAREGLLKYKKDDREPFPDVYRMFAGELTGDAVLARIKAAPIEPDERQKRLFYAELYVGLNDFVEGKTDAAEKHLRAMVANTWPAQAGFGPLYMWHVGRVHCDLLIKQREKHDAKP